ncbi:DUF3999 family protein [Labilibacter marinus]|uniref:DUF3999 family protein n=1 Tax=Labilibacter marinus TaxID=1477105 RepID=UPI00094FDF36|nr:DUF3999 family protein [Labilibacter marinus]
MNKRVIYIFILSFITSHIFAQQSDYKYQREIVGVDSLWHQLTLPDDIYPFINQDLSDLRVIGVTGREDTIEAPYVLSEKATAYDYEEVEFAIINKTRNKSAYYYTFQLSKEMAINEIKLDFKKDNYDWNVQLEGSHNQKEWFTVLSDYRIVSIKNEMTDYHFSKLSFPNANFEFFRLKIPSNKNPRLKNAKLVHAVVKEGEERKFTIKNTRLVENDKNHTTEVFAQLDKSVRISKIKIKVKDEFDYYRPVTLSYLKDSVKTETGWIYNYENLAFGTLNSLGKNEFAIKSRTINNLRLRIENKENEPLNIGLIEVTGYTNVMTIRFAKPGKYILCYGNETARKPVYDIQRFINRIPQDSYFVTLGKHTLTKSVEVEPAKNIISKYWLWAIMLVVIALLGWFSVKLLKEDKS